MRPESLVARLYKARYYTNGTLFEANVGHNPSFVRRSVWEARNFIKDGCRWSIGAGHMSILKQPWLQDEASPYISSVNQALETNVVASLMKIDIREWDEEVIKDMFNEADQVKILNTRIVSDRNEDVLI